jgi:hypothetical protein
MWIDVNSYSWSGYAVLAKNQIRSWVIQLTDGGKVRYSWYTDANGWSTPLIGNKSIPAGEWHHIAIVRNIEFDAADPNYGDIYTAIYIDGKFDNSVIYNNERLPKPNPNGLTIISVGHWGQFEGTFNGAIDELRLSNCNRFLYNHQAIDLAIEGGDELRRFKIGTIEIKEATY